MRVDTKIWVFWGKAKIPSLRNKTPCIAIAVRVIFADAKLYQRYIELLIIPCPKLTSDNSRCLITL